MKMSSIRSTPQTKKQFTNDTLNCSTWHNQRHKRIKLSLTPQGVISALFILLYLPSSSLASQSGSIPQELSPFSEKCQNAILNYVDNKITQNSTQHLYFKHKHQSDMASHKSRTNPREFSQAYPGILKDEYDYYREERDLKTVENSSLKKEETRIRRMLASLNREIEQAGKNSSNKERVKPLFLQKVELSQDISHLRERDQLNTILLQDLEGRLKLIEFENRFLIFASTISHHENSNLSHYIHWMKFIEPETATAKECSENLLRKRIKDSKVFYTENRIFNEFQLANRILDDLTLRSFAEKTKEISPYQQQQKNIQRSTASVKKTTQPQSNK